MMVYCRGSDAASIARSGSGVQGISIAPTVMLDVGFLSQDVGLSI